MSETSSGNESSGESRAKRRKARQGRKAGVGSSDAQPSRAKESREKRNNFGERRVSDRKSEVVRKYKNTSSKEVTGSGAGSVELRTKDNREAADTTQRESVGRVATDITSKTKTSSEGKAHSEATKTSRGTKTNDLSELKQPKRTDDTNYKGTDFKETGSKETQDKQASSTGDNNEDQGDESEIASDVEKPDKRSKIKNSSRTGDMDLRKKSLTLNLNSSARTPRAVVDSPVRENNSIDDDSESCSDTFDESPLVESRSFQVNIRGYKCLC